MPVPQALVTEYREDFSLTASTQSVKEPKNGRKLFIYQLDMVCMPLVGFDRQCHRLGMGGGFYDRSLANNKNPKLTKLGLAHDCQQVDVLANQPWDIPLDGVLTPTHYWQAP